MTLLEYHGTRRINTTPLTALLVINAGFVLAMLFAWTMISFFVAEPISWATWTPLSHASRPDLFDYPFVVVWALPTAGVILSWFAKSVQRYKLALTLALAPVLFLSMIFIYFYFVPTEFH